MAVISFARALRRIVEQDPDAAALVCGDAVWTRGDLERASNRRARAYAELGVKEGDLVTIGLPNGLEYFAACMGVWKLGAVPNPVSSRLPPTERAAIIARANPALVLGVDAEEAQGRTALPAGFEPDAALSDGPLPDRVAPHERALTTGGSTGLPKLILSLNPGVCDPASPVGFFAARRCGLVPGPLYHATPFQSAWRTIFAGSVSVVMERFDASRCLELVERHRVDRVAFVPTMMLRIWRLPEAERRARDLSSLEFVLSTAAPCPPWLMRAWIEWVGPEVMRESFGQSERIGGTMITGTEWLQHPGSVGRPFAGSQIRILDPETGAPCPPGVMGEIYMLPPTGQSGSTYRYVGAEPRRSGDGWESVGDMGYLDEDGYLYLGDRRTDMILCRGRNVYPAEVEAALEAHPHVRSSAVIGLPDDDLGQRIHALVEVAEATPEEELRAHVRERLVHYKVPESFEFVSQPLRDDAGKVRRSKLREERLRRGGAPTAAGG